MHKLILICNALAKSYYLDVSASLLKARQFLLCKNNVNPLFFPTKILKESLVGFFPGREWCRIVFCNLERIVVKRERERKTILCFNSLFQSPRVHGIFTLVEIAAQTDRHTDTCNEDPSHSCVNSPLRINDLFVPAYCYTENAYSKHKQSCN